MLCKKTRKITFKKDWDNTIHHIPHETHAQRCMVIRYPSIFNRICYVDSMQKESSGIGVFKRKNEKMSVVPKKDVNLFVRYTISEKLDIFKLHNHLAYIYICIYSSYNKLPKLFDFDFMYIRCGLSFYGVEEQKGVSDTDTFEEVEFEIKNKIEVENF